MTNALIIFIRNPMRGKVKTRLAAGLGNDEALRIYRLLLEKTRKTALETDAVRYLYYADFIPEQDEWQSYHFHKFLQPAGDLGARMREAFETAFAQGTDKALIIGSDCPELDGGILNQAFAALDNSDFVLGPATDGGYYLLGMKAPADWLFDNITWSTETVRKHTLERIAARNKNCFLLPELNDIDEAEDWRKYEQKRKQKI